MTDAKGNCLHRYAAEDDEETIRKVAKFLSKSRKPSEIAPFLVRNDEGVTPLHIAAMNASPQMLKTLLDSSKESDRCSRHFFDSNGRTPLHYAAYAMSVECCKLLMDERYGFPKDIRDRYGFTPFLLAVATPDEEAVEVIRLFKKDKHTASIVGSKSGKSALHIAAIADNLPVVKLLVDEYKCEVDVRDGELKTPLHYAAKHGHTEVVDGLIRRRADSSLLDKNGLTAAHYAVSINHSTLDFILKAANYDMARFRDKMGRTVLMTAALEGNIQSVKYCLQPNKFTIDETVADTKGCTALHHAARVGNLKICEMLVAFGWDPSSQDNCGATPLHAAAGKGETDIVRFLVHSGANVDAIEAQGRTALCHACLGGHADTLAYMIHRLKFSIEERDVLRNTLLHAAAFAGHPECISTLVDAGAFVTDTNKDDFTALHIAAERGKFACCERLLACGAAVNALSKEEHQTPLSCALTNGHHDLADFLASKGGMTPEEVKVVVALIIQSNQRKRAIEVVKPTMPVNRMKPRRRSSAFDDSDGPSMIRVNANHR